MSARTILILSTSAFLAACGGGFDLSVNASEDLKELITDIKEELRGPALEICTLPEEYGSFPQENAAQIKAYWATCAYLDVHGIVYNTKTFNLLAVFPGVIYPED
jgi:hypothetical protein